MDRDNRWERVQRAYDAVAQGKASFCADAAGAVEQSYAAKVTDEFMDPVRCHAKAIPGADDKLLYRLGLLADRMSVNIELPSQKSLALLAPDKSKSDILKPMAFVRDGIAESRADLVKYHAASLSDGRAA